MPSVVEPRVISGSTAGVLTPPPELEEIARNGAAEGVGGEVNDAG